jgi:hypothetical protein
MNGVFVVNIFLHLERQVVMRTFLSGVRTRQKHFRPYILRALIFVSIVSWQLIDVNPAQLKAGLRLISHGHTGIASSQTGNGASPSGQSMPVGDIAGWRQIFAEDFNTNVPVGGFPGTVYRGEFIAYPDGAQDTAGQHGAPSRYYPSKVISVGNGLLNLHLHTENGIPMVAAFQSLVPGNHLYGKYAVRFRSDALQGFKVAWLLWPESKKPLEDGEIDFPESDLDATISAYMHHKNGTSDSDQDSYGGTATYPSWHTASVEWSPDKVNFVLDGRSIGTSTARIPDTPMDWVIQTEACQPTCPAATTAGNFQIDWMTVYSPT